ncbi:putative F-box domain-containing protein [Lupinus albus]|uniref:Putative F-box domain-containing protein n=1 Tax=Lupinus albus TaxID=3870 RepID=A0A6A4Q2G8_LUPAL|nr:putative F-box domain-containing protein [Lupinus albus]
MGKISAKDKSRKIQKGRRKLRSTGNKYLKPGTISQLLYNQSPTSVSASSALVASGAAKACTDLGKKRVEVLNSRKSKGQCGSDVSHEDKVFDKTPLMLSPSNSVKPSGLLVSPKTPRVEHCYSDSRLESLPMDLMVKIICHLHHDQLKAVFHVSQRVRKAVVVARQFYFNYTTPDRSRLEMLSTMTPRPTERWPFLSKGDEKALKIRSPHTPKAPRHGPRPPSRLKVSELRQVAAVLFPESAFPTRCLMPSVIPKPTCKSLASNRVLFYEDELCQAVAQNKLL